MADPKLKTEFFCMWPGCHELTDGEDALYCREHVKLAREALPSLDKRVLSIPPDKRGASYGLATTIAGMAASSAMGIENPIHRTVAILACMVLCYLLGLRTQ